MPIVAKHNREYRSKGHIPSGEWPDDCYVQWGNSGLVLKEKGESYLTAFFEAFPKEGGFFRGEGPTLPDAEADCLGKYQRFNRCTHLWGRGTYTNGGAICRKCGAFMTRFSPIPRLGSFRDPISAMDLDLAMKGYCRKNVNDNFERRLWLRLTRVGIKLPDPDLEDYADACRISISNWYRQNRNQVDHENSGGLNGMFEALALRNLERELEDQAGEEPSRPRFDDDPTP